MLYLSAQWLKLWSKLCAGLWFKPNVTHSSISLTLPMARVYRYPIVAVCLGLIASFNALAQDTAPSLTAALNNPLAEVAPASPPAALGEPIQFLLSELTSLQRNVLTLADGSTWQTNITQLGFAGNTVLITGKNLTTGNNTLYLNGFQFTAKHKSGDIEPNNGYRLSVINILADGKRLILSHNLQAYVIDAHRQHSRHWRADNSVIVRDDFRTLVYLPTLETVTVQLAQSP
ncbi:hypothetical protein [Alishewanella tabrizica]|uniref:Uncharacterized protein n=1 Tax=Alishewanella tabrizica TaxID=671278 RepID=A0ABQ2WIE7_9ALTE|nr:hypothetical protein [Alishewanella tabrizica]GGW58083.1 hypothetical protein GCM10008111_12810 [Alishewanella tabrizica]